MIGSTRRAAAAGRAAVPVLVLVLGLALLLAHPAAGDDDRAGDGPGAARGAAARVDRVLAISIDGLNPTALRRLGREGAPTFHRLLRQGASTLNARAQVEQTVTLPNHTSMVTGRPIDPARGGHGVTWNDHRPGTTVQQAAGHDVSSIFRVCELAGESAALFSTKTKFSLFDRSWDDGVDRIVIREEDDDEVTRLARLDLVRHDRAVTFLHLGLADQTGHARGWLTPAYLRAVRHLDGLLADVLRTVRSRPSLRRLAIVLTADHGGEGRTHEDPTLLANYRVPFVVWGPGVERGADLYELNPERRDPGAGRPGPRGPQPVRNGDLANVTADLLGLDAVPGSRWDADQDLDWR